MRRDARWVRSLSMVLAIATILPLPAVAVPPGCVPLICATCTCNVLTGLCDCAQCSYYCLWW